MAFVAKTLQTHLTVLRTVKVCLLSIDVLHGSVVGTGLAALSSTNYIGCNYQPHAYQKTQHPEKKHVGGCSLVGIGVECACVGK